MKKALPLLLFLLVLLPLIADDYRIVPNYGHLGSTLALRADTEREVLISFGSDSYCLITDLDKKRIMNRFSYEGSYIDSAENPEFPEFLLLTEKDDGYLLTGYNWQTGESLFVFALPQAPFFLDYSRSGEIVLYGTVESPVILCDHLDGTRLDGPDRISSLLTTGYLGGSEKTFMGYNPSGEILYFDRFSSEVKGRVAVPADLKDIQVHPENIQYATARSEDSLYLINRQTGEVLHRLTTGEILSYTYGGGAITLLTVSSEESVQLVSYGVAGKRLKELSRRNIEDDRDDVILTALYYGRFFLAGSSTGDILKIESSSRSASLFPRSPLKPSLLTMGAKGLFMGTDNVIWVWESPFFTEEDLTLNSLLQLKRRSFSSPLTNFRFSSYGDDLLLWSAGADDKADIYSFDGTKDELTPFLLGEETVSEARENSFDSYNTPHREEGYKVISYREDLEVSVDASKTCLVNRLIQDGPGLMKREEIYRYAHPSLETAALVSDELILLGKNTFYGGRDAMSMINVLTGETTFINDDRDIVTQIVPRGEIFYTVGFKEENEDIRCIVRKHDINNLNTRGSELFNLEMAIDDRCRLTLGEDGTAYLTTAEGEWYRLDEKKQPSLAPTVTICPVTTRGDYIYTIERDHSLLISRSDNLEPLVKVFFYETGEWAAVSLISDYYFHSRGARELFTVYKY